MVGMIYLYLFAQLVLKQAVEVPIFSRRMEGCLGLAHLGSASLVLPGETPLHLSVHWE